MSPATLTLIIVSSTGFIISGLFSLYLLSAKRLKNTLNLLLGGLLLVLTIRIGKSVFYNFTELPVTIKNIGLAANLAVGPFLILYGKVLLQKHSLSYQHTWHFIPALLYFIFSPVLPNELGHNWWYLSYSFVISQQFFYLLSCTFMLKNKTAVWENPHQKGFLVLLVAIGFTWFTYLIIFMGLLPTYIFGAVSYSILVMLLIFFMFREKYSFLNKEKYIQSRLSKKQAQKYLQQIQQEIEQNKSFLNANLNIQSISKKTKLSSKIVSQVINEQMGLNFSAFINTYRIEEAKLRLTDSSYQNLTIASIAYDCGFNSISSFNTSFKTLTQQTPSQFRKKAKNKS